MGQNYYYSDGYQRPSEGGAPSCEYVFKDDVVNMKTI